MFAATSAPMLNPPRIPLTLSPWFYNITIKPNDADFTFEGRVEINFDCLQSTDEIWLYTLKLDIDMANVILTDVNKKTIPILNRTTVASQPQLSIFKLGNVLPSQTYAYALLFQSYKGYIERYAEGMGYTQVNGLYAINYCNNSN